MQNLKPNSLLQGGKYRIVSKLGQGGFGITYLAENTMLDGKVAIKEFFFKNFCKRDENSTAVSKTTQSDENDIVERFKRKFIKEARTIFKLSHPNIVRILDIFEENNTAYYVMEFIDGESLSDMVKRRGFIPEDEAIGYIKNVASALSYIHSKNMNHLDIKPGNIMKRGSDGKIFLIDFGVAKQYDAKTLEGTTTTPVGISHGYSPSEQYLKNGVQTFSPQSDVYALAATLFKLLTGNTPPEAMEVQDLGLPVEELENRNVSPKVIAAIVAAMKGRFERTQSVDLFMESLSDSSDEEETTIMVDPMEEERKQKEAEEKERRRQQAEAQAKAKAEAERKAREKARRQQEELQRKAQEQLADNNGDSQPSSNKKWLWIAIVAIAIGAIGIVGFAGKGGSNEEAAQQEVATLVTHIENAEMQIDKGPESKRNFVYTGEIGVDGLPSGQGTAEYPKTETSGACTFTGTFEHGITKEGEMIFKSNEKYKGTFDADGGFKEGVWTEKDGYYFKGTFKNGDPYNGTWYAPNGTEDGKVVDGKQL